MSEKTIDLVLNQYLRDAHAMEMNVHQMLVALVTTTRDDEMTALLEQHKSQTEVQIQRLEQRLQERGENTSTLRDVGAVATAFFKGLGDVARKDKAAKNARTVTSRRHSRSRATTCWKGSHSGQVIVPRPRWRERQGRGRSHAESAGCELGPGSRPCDR